MKDAVEIVRKAAFEFIKSCDRNYEFPAGGENELLTPSEEKLYSVLQTERISDFDKILELGVDLDWSASYSIVTFGVRLAVLAVRNKQRATYKLGVLALIAGLSKLDWRDILGVLSIFENCGIRLGVRFEDELKLAAKDIDQSRAQTTIDSFFSRAAEMRSVDIMGFVECGTENELTFKVKSA